MKVLKMIKVYAIIAAVIFSFFGGWKVHSWYEGNKEKEVIIKEVEVFNEQALKDSDVLLKAEIELDNFKDKFEKLTREAYEINKGICNSTTSHDNFNRLYNKAVDKANESSPGKI